MSSLNLKEFPIISTDDFGYVEIDVLKLSDNQGFTIMMNFFVDEPGTDEEDAVEGFSLDTAMFGETIKELADRIGLLFASGLFDNLNVGAHGTIWTEDGEAAGVVCWMHEAGALETNATDKPTIH